MWDLVGNPEDRFVWDLVGNPEDQFSGIAAHLMYQRTNGPENAHLKPDPGVLSHHEMTLTLNTHTPLLNS